MNIAFIFIIGVVIGLVFAICLIWLLMRPSARNQSRIMDYNERSLQALKDRNELEIQGQEMQERMLSRLNARLIESCAQNERIADTLVAINRNLESKQ